MPNTHSDDLLTRIQRKHACSRDSARRILKDLIDHHKRLSMRRVVGTGISAPVGTKKVFSAPISSKSTLRYPYRRETAQNVGEHPFKRTRNTDLDPISSISAKITTEHHENGVSEEIVRPTRSMHPIEPKASIKWLQIGEITLQKSDFIKTCFYHGMTKPEIVRFLMHYIPTKPLELPAEHYKRVYQQVYWATERS